MNVGNMSSRIILESPTSSSTDVYGQIMKTYSTASMWAEVSYNGGNELNSSAIQYSDANYTFTVRETGNVIDENCNVIYDGHTYNVIFADSRGRYIKLVGRRTP